MPLTSPFNSHGETEIWILLHWLENDFTHLLFSDKKNYNTGRHSFLYWMIFFHRKIQSKSCAICFCWRVHFFYYVCRKLEILRTGWRSWTLTVKVSMQPYEIFIRIHRCLSWGICLLVDQNPKHPPHTRRTRLHHLEMDSWWHLLYQINL
jgi:hypothetical protein